jgi:hypothetical protein
MVAEGPEVSSAISDALGFNLVFYGDKPKPSGLSDLTNKKFGVLKTGTMKITVLSRDYGSVTNDNGFWVG